jgi:hypothetical protein
VKIFFGKVFAGQPGFSGFGTLESLFLDQEIFQIQLQIDFLLIRDRSRRILLDKV